MANERALADQNRTTEVVLDDEDDFEDLERTCDLYFIGEPGGPIKIGKSYDPHKRLAMLQTGNPRKLVVEAVLIDGGCHEGLYHTAFAGIRLNGEWFKRTPEIEQEIAKVSALLDLDDLSLGAPLAFRMRRQPHPGPDQYDGVTSHG